jgi:hypothetical protein
MVRIIVRHVEELPGGVPALWTDEPVPGQPREVTLYLRADLPIPLADYFRAQAIRDCLPGVAWDDFTVTDGNKPALRAVG